MQRRSRSPGTRSASPRIPSFQAKPGRQPAPDLSSSNSFESPAVRFVAQHPQAPQPPAPQPIVDAPRPWPLPTPPITPMISDYSDQSPTSSVQGSESSSSPQTLNRHISFDSTDGRSVVTVSGDGTPMGAVSESPHRNNLSPVHSSVASYNRHDSTYVPQQPASSSSS